MLNTKNKSLAYYYNFGGIIELKSYQIRVIMIYNSMVSRNILDISADIVYKTELSIFNYTELEL